VTGKFWIASENHDGLRPLRTPPRYSGTRNGVHVLSPYVYQEASWLVLAYLRPGLAGRPAGYSVDHQPDLGFDDLALLRHHKDVEIFDEMAASLGHVMPYNETKLRLYAHADFHITVQGGNAHLLLLFSGGMVAILHRAGQERRHQTESVITIDRNSHGSVNFCRVGGVIWGEVSSRIARFNSASEKNRRLRSRPRIQRRLGNPDFFDKVKRILDSLTLHHVPVHLHGNNYAGVAVVENVPIPRVLEISFLRRDLDIPGFSTEPIPGLLDRPNHPFVPDICLNHLDKPHRCLPAGGNAATGRAIWLAGISAMIWRRVLVPATFTLRELHGVIQVAMGWEGLHLYDFHLHAARYGLWEVAASSPDITLAALRFRKGQRFIYEYDLNIPWPP
jgi:hypothetical protein